MFKGVWHALSAEGVLRKLKVTSRGLAEAEVIKRRAEFGSNELPRPAGRTALKILLGQFTSPLVAILIVAVVVSFGLGDDFDAQVILAAVVLNVIFGFIQEFRAERTIEALRRVVSYQAIVIRDSIERLIPAVELVPGDLVVLKTGERVVADCRLLKSQSLEVNEASLTGESTPVAKHCRSLEAKQAFGDRANIVYSGTTIIAGSGLAAVYATGYQTELGKLASLVRGTKEDTTPWQQRLKVFSRFLSFLILFIALALFGVGVLTGRSVEQMFAVSVAVAVAAIPEGLAIGVTVILVIGMRRILKEKALTRQLVAVETLGSTTVLCIDKTGTLTEGSMAVARLVTNNHDLKTDPDVLHRHSRDVGPSVSTLQLLKIGLLCNDAHVENEDKELEHRVLTGAPTEKALVRAAHAVGFTKQALTKDYPRIATLDFDSDRKYMATIHESKSGAMLFVKGAPEVVLSKSGTIDIDGKSETLTDQRRSELIKRVERLSRDGLRVLAFAYRSIDGPPAKALAVLPPLTFVGFAGIKDPLRTDAKQAVRTLQQAGLKVVMITGDHQLTAEAIARELRLPTGLNRVITGLELAQMDDHTLRQRIRQISVYARVLPSDKIRIVDAWQSVGEVVAMTGDGVNDAAALKAADIGIALGSGTDVAKEAAKIVLLDDDVKTIESAVAEGRIIFENIKKVTLYLLSDSFAAVTLVGLSLIAGLPLALTAAQILWINLVSDSFPNLALTVEPSDRNVMADPPRRRNEPLVDRFGKIMISSVSAMVGLIVFIVFMMVWRTSQDLILARTFAFACLGTTTLTYVFSLRSRLNILSANPFRNRWLTLSVLMGLLFQMAAIYLPWLQNLLGTRSLEAGAWWFILGINLIVLLFVEMVKMLWAPRAKPLTRKTVQT